MVNAANDFFPQGQNSARALRSRTWSEMSYASWFGLSEPLIWTLNLMGLTEIRRGGKMMLKINCILTRDEFFFFFFRLECELSDIESLEIEIIFFVYQSYNNLKLEFNYSRST